MSLNTRIKTIDLINSKQSFEFNQSGNLNIKYGCNFTDAKNGIDYDSLSMIENNILTFNMSINFDYQAECGRCLSVDTINSKNARDFSLNLDAENDYELDLESEFIDFEPFISEMIIEKLELNYLCNTNCKGLCPDCGVNMNKNKCNHDEKKLKESPFSSLSQLDL